MARWRAAVSVKGRAGDRRRPRGGAARPGAPPGPGLTWIGGPSTLGPLAAAIRDEQTANARGLVQAEAAILVPESHFDVQTLADQIESVLSNPQAAEHMARAALSVGRPDAADTLAMMVEELAQKKK